MKVLLATAGLALLWLPALCQEPPAPLSSDFTPPKGVAARWKAVLAGYRMYAFTHRAPVWDRRPEGTRPVGRSSSHGRGTCKAGH